MKYKFEIEVQDDFKPKNCNNYPLQSTHYSGYDDGVYRHKTKYCKMGWFQDCKLEKSE